MQNDWTLVDFITFKLNEAAKRIDTDNTESEKIKILVLSNTSEESKTIPTILAECKKLGLILKVINISNCTLIKKDDNSFTIDDENKKPFKISPDDTAVLNRRGVVNNTYTQEIVSRLEDANFFVVNRIKSIMACENKYITNKILEDAGLPIPRFALVQSEDALEKAIEHVGGKYPIVVKLLSGSQGIGVSIVDSFASLRSVAQTIWKLSPKTEMMLQEKIDSDYDLRIHVLTKRFNAPVKDETDSVLLGYMRRNRVEKDFRTNFSLGGSVEKVKLSKEQEELAIKAANVIGCTWAGVDIIVDKKSGKNYILEVNASAGTNGLFKATGVNVVVDIMKFLADKQNWNTDRIVVGFREVINIPELGDVVAKFDTGNGSLSCSMTFDKLDIDEKAMTCDWTLKDKKFTSTFTRWSETEVGKHFEKRPNILLDIIFKGKLYKDVEVSLVDRKDKSTKFLVNRAFMERIGCSVSPLKTFVATNFEDEYSAGDSKGQPYAGIKFENKKK